MTYHLRAFTVRIPGDWTCRRVLGNVLRVVWLDVLERHGWTVRAACDSVQPGTLLKGIETDLVVYESEEEPFDGEWTSFLLFKGAGEMSSAYLFLSVPSRTRAWLLLKSCCDSLIVSLYEHLRTGTDSLCFESALPLRTSHAHLQAHARKQAKCSAASPHMDALTMASSAVTQRPFLDPFPCPSSDSKW